MILFDPSATVDNIANMRLANAIDHGKLSLEDATSGIPTANFIDLILGQFRAATSFAMRVPPFLAGISQVVLIRTEKQVGRIDTGSIIASMAHIQTFGYWAIVEFVRHAMSLAHRASTEADTPIAVVVERALPLPAIVRATLVNHCPESLCQWAFSIGPMTTYVFALIAVSLGSESGQATTASAEYGIMEGHRNSPFLCLIRERFAVAARYFRVHFLSNYNTSYEESRT